MISPKEEAVELVKEMYKVHSDASSLITLYFAKQCALIAVDKILKVAFFAHDDIYNHYLEVKIELEKL